MPPKDSEVTATAQIKVLEDAAFERGKAEGAKAEQTRTKETVAEIEKRVKAEGATAERERIQAVLDASLPGHEALVQELAFDGKTTAPEAAQRVLAAEKTARDRRLANLKTDAKVIVPEATAPPAADSAAAEANLPIEDRAKKQWERDPELREEFTGLAAYTAFLKADAAGKVRILSKTAQ